MLSHMNVVSRLSSKITGTCHTLPSIGGVFVFARVPPPPIFAIINSVSSIFSHGDCGGRFTAKAKKAIDA
jgi:hypothetical protein